MIAPVMPTYARKPLEFERGSGAHLYTADGETYLDFAGGVAVSALGHGHPGLVQALTDQAARLWHVSNLFDIPGQKRLAQRLVEATFADTVFFGNSGAEAVECAIKTARRYHYASGAPERYRVITFEGAFHGRTLATIAAGGQAKLLDGFGPKVDGFDQVPFADLKAVRAAIGEETAAILLEPVQGEGGVRVVEPEILRQLRKLADDAGILLILDEIQTGMGRTGRLFAHEWAGITPDIMAIAKALGCGFPIGACLATAEAAKGMTAGTHGSTFGGNPLAMAVGNTVLNVMLEPEFLPRVESLSIALRQKLARLADEHRDIIGEVRGLGLMIGLKCKVPSGDLIDAAGKEKLLTVPAGDNVCRLLPPLNIMPADVDEALEKLHRACLALETAGRT
ncbi:Acetylornithine aminotransferase [hydrothermal vent metagenome]|uniref:Acetylornithine aminotransferase n=1 Tax=hydrothermal vent metagenome TaxID=652676 RepID=A0A3B0TFR8_9ZZZZ